MSYIVGTSFSAEKSVLFSLSYIFGIGSYRSRILCNKSGIGLDCRFCDIDYDQIRILENLIEASSFRLGQSLEKYQIERIRRFYGIMCYRGLRHKRGLPVRGQRTHTNAKRRSTVK
ncbi:unnamed protein product [Dictyota dichotoma]|uniref:Ribosomal protein S13 n=1 Tax=Dictyota dichotoma TaxID=2876 RepID=Q2TUB5_DICDH|nr:ribosomal protein S13 [Dictyota dichotoma]AAS79080.1 ribosomal protein S13 [Dictyota dichotoma]